jgi:hypothetical protein
MLPQPVSYDMEDLSPVVYRLPPPSLLP